MRMDMEEMVLDMDIDWEAIPEVGVEKAAARRKKKRLAPRRRLYWTKKYPELPKGAVDFLVRIGVYVRPRLDNHKQEKKRAIKAIDVFFAMARDFEGGIRNLSRRAALMETEEYLIAKNQKYGGERSDYNLFTLLSP